MGASAHAEGADVVDAGTCQPDDGLQPEVVLAMLSTGWRPLAERRRGEHGWVNERDNARIIYTAFREAGYSHAIALAAIVNAWSESSLDNTAVMDTPFVYRGRVYPRGSGAVGLFQLLPSRNGAGGPTGPEQGYSTTFMDGKWAGQAWQARRYGEEPDAWGRTYYDATDPEVNVRRILLEMERDGARVVAADARGASIAELADLFGHDIERPGRSTRYRRREAAEMLGPKLAYARNPNALFAREPLPDPVAPHEALARQESVYVAPSERVTAEPIGHTLRRPRVAGMPIVVGSFALGLALVVGRRRAAIEPEAPRGVVTGDPRSGGGRPRPCTPG